jgi:hypothetical protein
MEKRQESRHGTSAKQMESTDFTEKFTSPKSGKVDLIF